MTDIRESLNVVSQSAGVGQIAEYNGAGPSLRTVMMLSTSSNEVLPAYPLKGVGTGASGVPIVDLAVPGSDVIVGYAVANPKQALWTGKDILQMAGFGAVMNFTCGTELERWAKVGQDPTTFKLIAATTSNYIGKLLDVGTADATVRVELAIPLTVAP
jgi:hypothetical protein